MKYISLSKETDILYTPNLPVPVVFTGIKTMTESEFKDNTYHIVRLYDSSLRTYYAYSDQSGLYAITLISDLVSQPTVSTFTKLVNFFKGDL